MSDEQILFYQVLRLLTQNYINIKFSRQFKENIFSFQGTFLEEKSKNLESQNSDTRCLELDNYIKEESIDLTQDDRDVNNEYDKVNEEHIDLTESEEDNRKTNEDETDTEYIDLTESVGNIDEEKRKSDDITCDNEYINLEREENVEEKRSDDVASYNEDNEVNIDLTEENNDDIQRRHENQNQDKNLSSSATSTLSHNASVKVSNEPSDNDKISDLDPGLYDCTDCDKKGMYYNQYRLHRRIHWPKCPACHKKYPDAAAIEIHMRHHCQRSLLNKNS